MLVLNFLAKKGFAFEVGCIVDQACLKGRVIQGSTFVGTASLEVERALTFDNFDFEGIIPKGVHASLGILVCLCH